MIYYIQYAMFTILAGGGIWALSRMEPPTAKRKRVYQEKVLARQALQELNNSAQKPDK